MNMFQGEIDQCHADLIQGLVKAFKPQNILEFGWGGGRSHNAIMEGALYNQNKPHYTLVDNWSQFDFWNGKPAPAILESTKKHGKGPTLESFSVITANEKDYVYETLGKYTFDFIMSDADHQHTNEWVSPVYETLLRSPGVLIYHDTAESYPNLQTIKPMMHMHYQDAKVVEFTRSTLEYEKCGRGLLVIFKP